MADKGNVDVVTESAHESEEVIKGGNIDMEQTISTGGGEAATCKQRRVLVIDDSTDDLEITRMLLELWGHEVQTASGGLPGIEAAELFRPEVILLDIGLRGIDGYEVARLLRQNPVTAKALLIAVSGYGQKEDFRKSKAAGFDHHLVKPADTGQLLALISG